MAIDVDAMKAKNLPKATFGAIFEVTDGEIAPDDVTAIDAYLGQFVAPNEKGECCGCGGKLTGGFESVLGLTTFRWGLAHGEGFCSECKYPARAYHFNVGPIKRFECVLQVHPDLLIADNNEEDED